MSVPYELNVLDQSLKRRDWSRSRALKLQQVSALKHRFLGPPTEFLLQMVWAGAWESAFLRHSQVLLMLPVEDIF